ncbi:FAD-dependent oxidoreductase [Pseudomonas faucium]|uniref:FAD-dependent oxidoreductase n=1 Tax=Pseudomonas faucium TaxID=2740518 RepID=UPI00159682DD|nr:FAD-dependent oxidoreductase [Pseudomonas faucium]
MIRWDECCDVLVIGAGAGGMTAALRAHDLGLDTLLIEKRDRYGGRSVATAGVVCVHGQGRAMLEYLERDTRVRFSSLEPQPFAGAALGEELLRLRAPSPDTLMIGRMAMTLDEARVLQGRGRGWAHLAMKVLWRYWRDLEGRKLSRRDRFLTQGSALAGALRCSLLDRRVPLWLNCSFEQLLRADHRVAGARVLRDGQWLNIKARHGLVIASRHCQQAMRPGLTGLYATGADASLGAAMTHGYLAANQIHLNSQQRQGEFTLALTGR